MKRYTRLQKIALVVLIAVIVAVLAGWVFRAQLTSYFLRPTKSSVQTGVSGDGKTNTTDVETIASGLNVPWSVVFLQGASLQQGGTLLVAERTGSLQLMSGQNKQTIAVAGVEQSGEGGLLGLALHPEFAKNNYIYLYKTTKNGAGELINRVERYRLGAELTDPKVIIDNIPAAGNHNGGRIAFGPDDLLYVGTGDAGVADNAQNKASLAGKILRVTDDGAVPRGNPFNSAIYSYGHRNVQGLAWDSAGNLWATEHGRSGAQSGFDELNWVEAGANYGWPTIEGDETSAGMKTPVRHSGANDTWAPAGMAFYDGSLYFAGLRGQSLYQAKLRGTEVVELKAHFRQSYGRLRDVVLGSDNLLYVTTSNQDGRGTPTSDDDRIIRINPALFR